MEGFSLQNWISAKEFNSIPRIEIPIKERAITLSSVKPCVISSFICLFWLSVVNCTLPSLFDWRRLPTIRIFRRRCTALQQSYFIRFTFFMVSGKLATFLLFLFFFILLLLLMLLLLLIWVRIVSFSGRYISLLFAVSSAYIDPTILPLFIFFFFVFISSLYSLFNGRIWQ